MYTAMTLASSSSLSEKQPAPHGIQFGTVVLVVLVIWAVVAVFGKKH